MKEVWDAEGNAVDFLDTVKESDSDQVFCLSENKKIEDLTTWNSWDACRQGRVFLEGLGGVVLVV